MLLFLVMGLLTPYGVSTAAQAAPAGPFATILFSRTEMTAADGCVASDTGIARLDTDVAPFLQSLGVKATASLQTGPLAQSSQTCTHYRSSMMASWDDAGSLASNYGWNFTSHTASYPSSFTGMTAAQVDAETCGSATTIERHGLPGAHGMISYPGAGAQATDAQTNYGSKCFAWGRGFGRNGVTTSADAAVAPYWQRIAGAEGGSCNDSTLPCYNTTMIAGGARRYVLPSTLIGTVNSLSGDKWFTLQQFLLVKDKSPTYTTSKVAWDCTSPDPAQHWTNDNERYCYNDWQEVIRALVQVPGITVTDPLSVGVAWGRPSTYPATAVTAPVPTPITEYVKNPSLEGGSMTGWGPYNGSSATASVQPAGGAKDGAHVARVTNSAAVTGTAGIVSRSPHWVGSSVAGKKYTGSVWLSGRSGTVVDVQLRECSSTGSCPAAATVRVSLPTSGWVQARVTYTARADGNQIRFATYGSLPSKSAFMADLFSLTAS